MKIVSGSPKNVAKNQPQKNGEAVSLLSLLEKMNERLERLEGGSATAEQAAATAEQAAPSAPKRGPGRPPKAQVTTPAPKKATGYSHDEDGLLRAIVDCAAVEPYINKKGTVSGWKVTMPGNPRAGFIPFPVE